MCDTYPHALCNIPSLLFTPYKCSIGKNNAGLVATYLGISIMYFISNSLFEFNFLLIVIKYLIFKYAYTNEYPDVWCRTHWYSVLNWILRTSVHFNTLTSILHTDLVCVMKITFKFNNFKNKIMGFIHTSVVYLKWYNIYTSAKWANAGHRDPRHQQKMCYLIVIII